MHHKLTNSLFFLLFQQNKMIILIPFLFLTFTTTSSSSSFPGCHVSFNCGAALTNITYPFTGGLRPIHCGPPQFNLICHNNTYVTLTISNSLTFRVLSINQTSSTLTLARSDLYDNVTCPEKFANTTFDTNVFVNNDHNKNVTIFYGCTFPTTYRPDRLFSCHAEYNETGYSSKNAFYVVGPIPYDPVLKGIVKCDVLVTVPVSGVAAEEMAGGGLGLGEALMMGFSVGYEDRYRDRCLNCSGFGGLCGFDSDTSNFICICDDRICSVRSSGRSTSHKIRIAILVAGVAIGCLILGLAIFALRKRRKQMIAKSADQFTERKIEDVPFTHLNNNSFAATTSITTSTSFSQSTMSYPSSKYDTGKASTYFGVRVFNYVELEEATDNFNPAREIGDGGFGSVFYGRLDDGREVAVKRLYENNFKRAEQFMNEVEILTRLNHINLVKLYGCTSRRSRELLLVYEYIANGTVADHLHGKRANSGLLSWPIRLSIALETAQALAYLHKSDIIHRDVKTTNILLENDFRVKVADFGLSRLFPNDVTHVSTAPQGTPGYVDPEYYQCYHLTEKSDVYSFGVVLAELISSKQAVDITRDRHNINLSTMAINKIQNHELSELVDPSLGFETNKSANKMISSVAEVAFRCLQSVRDMRPSMEEVLEALKRIKNEDFSARKEEAKAMDIVIGDETVLLPPFSPNSVVADKWISNASTTPNTSG